jgi:hypothetical protein
MSTRWMTFRLGRLAVAAVVALGALAGLGLLAAAPAALAGGFYYPAGASFTFGSAGAGEGRLSSPQGVAVDGQSGDVYVADEGNNRVEIFNAQGGYVGQIAGGETPAGSLQSPDAVAVDNSASSPDRGDVYVTDPGHGVVDVFKLNATSETYEYAGQLTGTPASFEGELYGVAVDGSGDVWVYESNGNVDEFNTSWVYETRFNTGRGTSRGFAVDASGTAYALLGGAVGKYNLSESEFGHELAEFDSSASAVAVDESDHAVLVDRSSGVDVHGPGGEPYSEPLATLGYGNTEEPGISGSFGVAVNETTGTVYVSQGEADSIAVFPLLAYGPPTFGAPQAAGSVTRTSATLFGSVQAHDASTVYQFQYGTTSSYGGLTEPTTVGGSRPHAIEVGFPGLAPGTTYHYRLIASNQYGTTTGPEQTFTTNPATPPIVSTGQASEVMLTSATVGGTIDAQGLETSYELDFGTGSEYGTSIAGEAGQANEPVAITLTLHNLAPGTTYHYRLIAVNSDGRVYGQDETFTTPAEPHPITLPNTETLLATPAIAFPTSVGETPPPVKAKKKAVHHKHKAARRKKSGRGGRRGRAKGRRATASSSRM